MKTIHETTTFTFAALLYLLVHLRGGADAKMVLAGTAIQLLTTLPYCIGFTFIAVRTIRYLHHGKLLPWDRTARIFFTVGIFFGFFFGLHEYIGQAVPEQTIEFPAAGTAPSLSGSLARPAAL